MRFRRGLKAIGVAVALCAMALFLFQRFGASPATHRASPSPSKAQTAPKIDNAQPPIIKISAEADIRSAFSDLCSGTVTDPLADLTKEELAIFTKDFDNRMQSIAKRLSESPLSDQLHTAALIEKDKERRVALLAHAIASDPNNALILWHGVHACSDFPDSDLCPLRNWEDRLIALDGQNSEVWARVAANRYFEGDEIAALDALRQAGSVAESRLYWVDTIRMADRALASYGLDTFAVRSATAIGLASASIPNFSTLTKMCREHSKINPEWAYACLAYGERARIQHTSELGSMIAAAVETQALKDIGEFEQASLAEQNSDSRRDKVHSRAREHAELTYRLILTNPNLFSFFLDNVEQYGEYDAKENLQNEIEHLLTEQPELACKQLELPDLSE